MGVNLLQRDNAVRQNASRPMLDAWQPPYGSRHDGETISE